MTSYIYGQVKATDPSNPFATETQEEGLKDYRSYVDYGYQSLLGRSPGEIGYDYWTKDLKSGQAHYAATQGLSSKDAFQKSLADFMGNLARHAPGTTHAHDVNTPGWDKTETIDGKEVKVNQQEFAGEFKPTNPDVTDITGSSSPYANIINTAYDRIHGRTAGAIGMDYWGNEMANQIAGGMSQDEATALLYKNLVLNPEAKSNLIDGEGPNLQPQQQATNNFYGGGGSKTNVYLANDNDSPTAADQMKLSQPDPLVNQASIRDDYGRANRQNRNGNRAGGVGGLNIGGIR
tara:strand:- start:11 stop:883 length:873 start_codon:yes stop_codon:yes gene_type:complete